MTAPPRVSPAAAGTWAVRDSGTTVRFTVRSLGREVTGSVAVSWGEVVVDAYGAPVSARACLDLRSVATGIDRRDADLRAPRYLDTDRHPTMTWSARRFARAEGGGWTADGVLELRGTSAPLLVRATPEQGSAGGRLRIRGTAVLDRTSVGIRAPRLLIGQQVRIDVDAELVLEHPAGAGPARGSASSAPEDRRAASPRRPRLGRALAGGSLAGLLLLAGCGSSDDDPAEAASGGDAAGTSPAADVDAFCRGVVDLDALASPDSEIPSPEEVTAFGEQVAEPVRAIADNAPEQAAAAAADLLEIQGRLAEGDASALEEPATFATLATIEQAVADECGFTNVAVTGADFAFEGVPATVPSGEVNFLMTNTSGHDEDHVMLVTRTTDGSVITPEEFTADPEAAFGRLEVVGAAFAVPHEVGGVTLDMAPGSYLLICPISADEASPPHFVLGMITSLTVV